MEANGQVDLSLAKPGDECHLRSGRNAVFFEHVPAGEQYAGQARCWHPDGGNGIWNLDGFSNDDHTPSPADILRVTRDGVQITPAVPPEPVDKPKRPAHVGIPIEQHPFVDGEWMYANYPGQLPESVREAQEKAGYTKDRPKVPDWTPEVQEAAAEIENEGCVLCGKQDSEVKAADSTDAEAAHVKGCVAQAVITGPGRYHTRFKGVAEVVGCLVGAVDIGGGKVYVGLVEDDGQLIAWLADGSVWTGPSGAYGITGPYVPPPEPVTFPELVNALREAEAGLEFAGADKQPPTDFVPAPTLALRAVRGVLSRLGKAVG